MFIVDVNCPDTGNQSFKMALAINRHTQHRSISFIRGGLNYLRFPCMFRWTDGLPAWVGSVWSHAHVLHVHGDLRKTRGWPAINPHAAKLIHQHARIYDTPYQTVWDDDEKNGVLRCVSTLNLLPWVKNNPRYWIPAPMDISMFALIKKKYYAPHDTIRICQTATNLACKKTDVFLSAMKQVMAKHKNVELISIKNMDWYSCQKIKASCDILFDQFLSYGSTCLESWCFGYPAITGMDDATFRICEDVLGDKLPFARATEENLADVLEKFVMDESLRKEYAVRGRAYVEKYHAYPVVASKMIELYREAIETQQPEALSSAMSFHIPAAIPKDMNLTMFPLDKDTPITPVPITKPTMEKNRRVRYISTRVRRRPYHG